MLEWEIIPIFVLQIKTNNTMGKNKNEKEFTNFTPQQTAYLDVYKLNNELHFITEKLAVMEMPCSVVDRLMAAINHIESARETLFKIMNGDSDPFLDF